MRILLIALIDDPFDPPGYERFGGGHCFLFDFIRYLVRQGDEIDILTRLNASYKPEFEQIGLTVRVHRLPVGPAKEIRPEELGPLLDELSQAASDALGKHIHRIDAFHSQYWLSGEVARKLQANHKARHVHHPLSFIRHKIILGDGDASAALRESAELAIYSSADCLVLLSPSEKALFIALYPEVAHVQCVIVPHGADDGTFYPRPERPIDHFRRTSRRLEKGASTTPHCD